MDLEALRTFSLLADELHFARTAARVHKSPSAVSRIIQQLEEETGAALFWRDRREVRLTPAGRQFLAFAARTLAAWEETRHQLAHAGNELQGTLRVFCSVTASTTVLPGPLHRFRARHPRVHIQLDTGDPALAIEQVQRQTVEVAVAAVPSRLPRGIVARDLTSTALVLAVPRSGELADRVRATRRSWGQLPWIVPRGGAVREAVDGWFRQRRMEPPIYAETSGHEAILALVALGLGVGFVPELVLNRGAGGEVVATVPVETPPTPLRVGLVARRGRVKEPLIAAFWASGETA